MKTSTNCPMTTSADPRYICMDVHATHRLGSLGLWRSATRAAFRPSRAAGRAVSRVRSGGRLPPAGEGRSGRGGPHGPSVAARPGLCLRAASRRRSCSPGSACESLGPPGFPRGTQEGARPSSRPPACWGPGHPAGACGIRPERISRGFGSQPRSAPSCIPELF